MGPDPAAAEKDHEIDLLPPLPHDEASLTSSYATGRSARERTIQSITKKSKDFTAKFKFPGGNNSVRKVDMPALFQSESSTYGSSSKRTQKSRASTVASAPAACPPPTVIVKTKQPTGKAAKSSSTKKKSIFSSLTPMVRRAEKDKLGPIIATQDTLSEPPPQGTIVKIPPMESEDVEMAPFPDPDSVRSSTTVLNVVGLADSTTVASGGVQTLVTSSTAKTNMAIRNTSKTKKVKFSTEAKDDELLGTTIIKDLSKPIPPKIVVTNTGRPPPTPVVIVEFETSQKSAAVTDTNIASAKNTLEAWKDELLGTIDDTQKSFHQVMTVFSLSSRDIKSMWKQIDKAKSEMDGSLHGRDRH